jgi:putative addiction module antidote
LANLSTVTTCDRRRPDAPRDATSRSSAWSEVAPLIFIKPPHRGLRCVSLFADWYKFRELMVSKGAFLFGTSANGSWRLDCRFSCYYNGYYNALASEVSMVKLKVTTVGSSAGVVLPKEVLARLNIQKGDSLFLTDAPDGYRITPYNPGFERQMTLVRRVMNERRNVLRELAK